jgi:hypothetical protein
MCYTQSMGCATNYPLLNTKDSAWHKTPLQMLGYMALAMHIALVALLYDATLSFQASISQSSSLGLSDGKRGRQRGLRYARRKGRCHLHSIGLLVLVSWVKRT